MCDSSKSPDVGGNVRGPARSECAFFQIDDRHGSFRRNAFYAAPPIAVQHNVADNKNLYVCKSIENAHLALAYFESMISHQMWATVMCASCVRAVRVEGAMKQASQSDA